MGFDPGTDAMLLATIAALAAIFGLLFSLGSIAIANHVRSQVWRLDERLDTQLKELATLSGQHRVMLSDFDALRSTGHRDRKAAEHLQRRIEHVDQNIERAKCDLGEVRTVVFDSTHDLTHRVKQLEGLNGVIQPQWLVPPELLDPTTNGITPQSYDQQAGDAA